MILAETLPDPNSYSAIGWLLVSLGALVAIINGGMKLFDRLGGKQVMPQPLSVEMSETLVTKADFKEHTRANEEAHKDIFSKLGGVERGGSNKISVEVNAIHLRVNTLEKAIGGLEAATTIQNQQLANLDSKITQLLQRK